MFSGSKPTGASRAPAAADGTVPELPPEEARKRAAMAKQAAAALGEVVSLLIRSPSEKQHSLADLEWMVMPAIMTGQYAVADAQSKQSGAVMPVGAVLWAFVSNEIDQQLSSSTSGPVRLKPQDWRSGDIPWVVMAIGDPKILGGILQNLAKTVFKDKPARMRAKGPDGKIVVGRLEVSAEPPQS
ncbi:MAG: toxin-activating lysine-acyltransferase [Hyphomicrobium sp.]